MRLSVDKINEKSPYWVISLDEKTFRFVTDNGIVYRVGFYQDQYFLGDRAYHFFIANENKEVNPPKDVNVYKVITSIIEEFFRQDKSVMLYICDPHDHRESVRDSLYKRWFNNYPKHDELTLQAEELDFEGYIVYTGMIIRNDHPEYNDILALYRAFVQRAISIFKVQPK